MKPEHSSPVVENTTSKQAWTEPTLTNLSVPLETLAMGLTGSDGGNNSNSLT